MGRDELWHGGTGEVEYVRAVEVGGCQVNRRRELWYETYDKTGKKNSFLYLPLYIPRSRVFTM
jgi:hypothetical protein